MKHSKLCPQGLVAMTLAMLMLLGVGQLSAAEGWQTVTCRDASGNDIGDLWYYKTASGLSNKTKGADYSNSNIIIVDRIAWDNWGTSKAKPSSNKAVATDKGHSVIPSGTLLKYLFDNGYVYQFNIVTGNYRQKTSKEWEDDMPSRKDGSNKNQKYTDNQFNVIFLTDKGTVTKSVEDLKDLDLSGTGMTNLGGIAYFRNLRKLNLSGTNIQSDYGVQVQAGDGATHLVQLQFLNSLRFLDVSNCQGLKRLNIDHMLKLQYLNVNHSHNFCQLDVHTQFPHMKVLRLSDCSYGYATDGQTTYVNGWSGARVPWGGEKVSEDICNAYNTNDAATERTNAGVTAGAKSLFPNLEMLECYGNWSSRLRVAACDNAGEDWVVFPKLQVLKYYKSEDAGQQGWGPWTRHLPLDQNPELHELVVKNLYLQALNVSSTHLGEAVNINVTSDDNGTGTVLWSYSTQPNGLVNALDGSDGTMGINPGNNGAEGTESESGITGGVTQVDVRNNARWVWCDVSSYQGTPGVFTYIWHLRLTDDAGTASTAGNNEQPLLTQKYSWWTRNQYDQQMDRTAPSPNAKVTGTKGAHNRNLGRVSGNASNGTPIPYKDNTADPGNYYTGSYNVPFGSDNAFSVNNVMPGRWYEMQRTYGGAAFDAGVRWPHTDTDKRLEEFSTEGGTGINRSSGARGHLVVIRWIENSTDMNGFDPNDYVDREFQNAFSSYKVVQRTQASQLVYYGDRYYFPSAVRYNYNIFSGGGAAPNSLYYQDFILDLYYPTAGINGSNEGFHTGINDAAADVAPVPQSVTYFNVAGQQSREPFAGVNIVRIAWSNGKVTTKKELH